MKEFDVEFESLNGFKLNRTKEVLAVIIFPDNTILVSRKGQYPENIYRLTTGGIDGEEEPEEALKREIYEETGITEFKSKPLALINYKMNVCGKKSTFQTFVYIVNVEEQKVVVMDPNENITDFKRLTMQHFKKATKLLGEIKPIKDQKTPWDEWGKFRKIAHDIIIEELSK